MIEWNETCLILGTKKDDSNYQKVGKDVAMKIGQWKYYDKNKCDKGINHIWHGVASGSCLACQKKWKSNKLVDEEKERNPHLVYITKVGKKLDEILLNKMFDYDYDLDEQVEIM